jgi:Tfp pilus assembly protein PilV
MSLKNLNSKSGFMLSEVLIALVVVSLVIIPVMNVISNALRTADRYRAKNERFFAMKNILSQQSYFIQNDKSKNKVFNESIKNPKLVVNYTCSPVKKTTPFDKFQDYSLKNLLLQKVQTTGQGVPKESIICFVYKP